MRSTVGGVGMPTGDGVTNSPSSPLISRNDAGKRRVQLRALEVRFRHVDARVRHAGGVLGRGACGSGRFRAALRLIGRLLGREPVGPQLHHALGITFRDGG